MSNLMKNVVCNNRAYMYMNIHLFVHVTKAVHSCLQLLEMCYKTVYKNSLYMQIFGAIAMTPPQKTLNQKA